MYTFCHKIQCAILTICTISVAAVPTTSICSEPWNKTDIIGNLSLEIQERFRDEEAFFVLPEYGDTVAELINKENEAKFGSQFQEMLYDSIQQYQFTISGNPTCDRKSIKDWNKNKANDELLTVDTLSTCPWHIVLDYDENREPKRITKATCTCLECRSPRTGRRCPGHVCQEVVKRVPVIRRLCYQGVYIYTTHIESVPIGCTCIKPKTINTRVRRSC